MTMRFLFLSVLPIVALLTLASGCRHHTEPNPDTVAPVEQTVDDAGVCIDMVPDTVAAEPVAKPVTMKPKKQITQATGPSRQVYVTGYNSFGRLWGYVTMKGDQGTGEIHDAEENHYNVRCTRHGNELFAVDQNSRQYVLKISE